MAEVLCIHTWSRVDEVHMSVHTYIGSRVAEVRMSVHTCIGVGWERYICLCMHIERCWWGQGAKVGAYVCAYIYKGWGRPEVCLCIQMAGVGGG